MESPLTRLVVWMYGNCPCDWLCCLQVLIFSQMTSILDILMDYCYLRSLQYSRLDGSMSYAERDENVSLKIHQSVVWFGLQFSLSLTVLSWLSSVRFQSFLKILRSFSSCWAPELEDLESISQLLTQSSYLTVIGWVHDKSLIKTSGFPLSSVYLYTRLSFWPECLFYKHFFVIRIKLM